MKYFFVSQRGTFKVEHAQRFLWAPQDGLWHHESMRDVKKDDVIIQYNGAFVGIGCALRDCYPAIQPSNNSFNKWGTQGYKVDVEQYHFVTPVKKESVIEELYQCQPKTHGPIGEKKNIKQCYLFPANEAMVDAILNKALAIDQSPAQFEIVKKIREILKIETKPIPPKEKGEKMQANNSLQKIFFGAPGTGKSYKVNSILGAERKNSFAESSEIAKSNHYADVLSEKKYVDCDVWVIDDIGFLEKKLAEFETDDKRENPRHSALSAYIDFFKKYREENRELRTTFHPDYDYAQFVGAYKPKKKPNADDITYSFVPQVFAKAYAAAWTQYINAGKQSTADNQVYLVIEEINRGNCAQIFGDIFQLLDRDGDGFSQYSIDADFDFSEWLQKEFEAAKIWETYKEKVGEGKLKLPPNMNIFATMNTSDQSLFPMDSAFKRRFDWEYEPISFEGKEAAKYEIDVIDSNGKRYLWKDFVETVNEKILKLTESEDKQLGEFFIKPDEKNEKGELIIISKDRFLGKVMFYLWNEVCKDEHNNGSFFRESENGEFFTFQDLYKKDSEKRKYTEVLKNFMEKNLKLEGSKKP